jgi:hypothetical protein
MREHPGLRDDLSEIGDGYSELRNVSHINEFELRRRPGMWSRFPTEARAGKAWDENTLFTEVGETVLVQSLDSGSIVTQTLDGVTLSTKSINANVRPSSARSNGSVYITNDYDRMKVVRSSQTIQNAGISVPLTLGAPTITPFVGGVDDGVRLVRFRWYNSSTGVYSSASPAITIDTTGNGGSLLDFLVGGRDYVGAVDIDMAELADDDFADTILVQMTLAGGTEFYDANFRNVYPLNTSTSSSINLLVDADDATLAVNTVTGTNSGVDSDPPPVAAYVEEHNGRLFVLGAYSHPATIVFNQTNQGTSSDVSDLWVGRYASTGGALYLITDVSGTTITFNTVVNLTGSTDCTIVSTSPDTLYWSEPGQQESFIPDTNARKVFSNSSDTPLGMVSHGSELYIFGNSNISILSYQNDPATGGLSQVSNSMGIWNDHCLVKNDQTVFGWGPSGAWMMVGTLPRHISRPIGATSRIDGVDKTQRALFTGFYDPQERTVQWAYTPVGGADPTESFCLDTDRMKWTERHYETAVVGSVTMSASDSQLRAHVADKNGYGWFLKEGTFDGIDDGYKTVSSVDPVTPRSTLHFNESHGDIRGAYLTDPSTGSVHLVTSWNATTAVITPDLSADPIVGQEFWIGSIRSQVTSKRSGATNDRGDMERPQFIVLETASNDGGEALVTVRSDLSNSDQTFTFNQDDVFTDGVTISDGKLYFNLDGGIDQKDGYIATAAPSDHARLWQVELVSEKPQGTLKLLDIRIESAQEDVSNRRIE